MSARFWRQVAGGSPGDCWPWRGRRLRRAGADYGEFRIGRPYFRAHRVAFFLTHGRWPNVARHSCDNPPCCNPAHILDGTQADNVRDSVDRGRARGGGRPGVSRARGAANPAAVLTAEDVRDVRRLLRLGWTTQAAADLMGVSRRTVQYIASGARWGHIDG